MYLTYVEYQTMGGTLEEAAFNNFEFQAEALVNWYTFNRLKKNTTFPTELKRLVFCLIALAQSKDGTLSNSSGSGSSSTTGSAIASQSNDGVSISYNVLSAKDLMDSIKTESETLINQYLQGVMNEAGRLVLYRGVYPDE